MEKLSALSGSAGALIILALVISLGLFLGKIKIKGVALGTFCILLVGIVFGHFGLTVIPSLLSFVKDFGLILFVFSIGLQVGPGFFQSFRKAGLPMNLLATGMVLLAMLTTWLLHILTGEPLDLMTGIMTGAIVNTPSLGAAQETLSEAITASGGSVEQAFEASSKLASAYAAAYPLGVLIPIMLLIFFKSSMHIDIEKEKLAAGKGDDGANAFRMACMVANPAIEGKALGDVMKDNKDLHFVVSRLMRDGQVMFPEMDQVLKKGDRLLIVTDNNHKDTVSLIFGQEDPVDMKEWQREGVKLISRRLSITNSSITGKTLRGMDIRHKYGVTVTRIIRSGVELQADGDFILQVGDVMKVVGYEDGIAQLAKEVGNQPDNLRKPNLAIIFLGIALGVLVGLIPIRFPSMPQPLRLGLAGGPLMVAILLSYFGPKLHITTYTALSANLMIREVGISLFTAAVGLGAGEHFVSSLVSGGYIWILYGLAITTIPMLVTAIVARRFLKMDFFKICGLLSGAGTNPPMLAFAEQTYGNGRIAVNYATVYPLTMFLRVVAAQVMIMMFL